MDTMEDISGSLSSSSKWVNLPRSPGSPAVEQPWDVCRLECCGMCRLLIPGVRSEAEELLINASPEEVGVTLWGDRISLAAPTPLRQRRNILQQMGVLSIQSIRLSILYTCIERHPLIYDLYGYLYLFLGFSSLCIQLSAHLSLQITTNKPKDNCSCLWEGLYRRIDDDAEV